MTKENFQTVKLDMRGCKKDLSKNRNKFKRGRPKGRNGRRVFRMPACRQMGVVSAITMGVVFSRHVTAAPRNVTTNLAVHLHTNMQANCASLHPRYGLFNASE